MRYADGNDNGRQAIVEERAGGWRVMFYEENEDQPCEVSYFRSPITASDCAKAWVAREL